MQYFSHLGGLSLILWKYPRSSRAVSGALCLRCLINPESFVLGLMRGFTLTTISHWPPNKHVSENKSLRLGMVM